MLVKISNEKGGKLGKDLSIFDPFIISYKKLATKRADNWGGGGERSVADSEGGGGVRGVHDPYFIFLLLVLIKY